MTDPSQSKRAERRHKRLVKLARRYSILRSYSTYRDDDLTPKCRHWHLRCNCFGDRDRNRTREEREAMDQEAR